ncbi:hypothetical protein DOTSEDRAFT_69145 [Dothistroma septosporum NZE10]|uniref:Uncharacterized protein n=1 Tax=Dothistroma septosporum (strain NZE10 / CBS 128990) TaxID=675120 RepID=N1PXD0_DOTSN|nr:hypothetical protein DOTSEDRAFT_69145 [Dothistroma septosporum NZE10]
MPENRQAQRPPIVPSSILRSTFPCSERNLIICAQRYPSTIWRPPRHSMEASSIGGTRGY